jgi:hypothetical protein
MRLHMHPRMRPRRSMRRPFARDLATLGRRDIGVPGMCGIRGLGGGVADMADTATHMLAGATVVATDTVAGAAVGVAMVDGTVNE